MRYIFNAKIIILYEIIIIYEARTYCQYNFFIQLTCLHLLVVE